MNAEIIETIQVNWFLLLSHTMWITGTAIIVALFAYGLFTSREKNFYRKPIFEKGGVIAFILIVSSVLPGYFEIPHNKLILAKIENPKPLPTQWKAGPEPVRFAPGDLTIDAHNKSHSINNEKMQDNTIVLLWDGFVRTPFVHFKKGVYRVEFQAWGTRAKDEFAKLKIEFEIPDKNNFLYTSKDQYVTLSGKKKTYVMTFQIHEPTATAGRVRITYFNDLHIEGTLKGRDVWLKGVSICSER